MSEPLDIISGINSLDDVLSSTGYVLQQTTLDDLRKLDTPEATQLLGDITSTLTLLFAALTALIVSPSDPAARKQYALHANNLYTLSEDGTMLLP